MCIESRRLRRTWLGKLMNLKLRDDFRREQGASAI
jgi:hypothetical protein